MNTKTILDKLKEIVFEKEVTETFVDVKDVDGNILRTDSEELAVGDAVLLITEEGEAPAAEGEYILEDGMTITLDAEGIITEIVESPAEDTEDEDGEGEELAEELAEETPEVESVPEGDYILADGTVIVINAEGVATWGETTEPVEDEAFKALTEKYDVLAEKFGKIETELKEVSGEPAEDELKIEKAGFKKTKKDSIVSQLSNFRK